MIKCKNCMHWIQTDDYSPMYGICSVKMGDKVAIECQGGWDGCIIGDIETEEDFFCAAGESSND